MKINELKQQVNKRYLSQNRDSSQNYDLDTSDQYQIKKIRKLTNRK